MRIRTPYWLLGQIRQEEEKRATAHYLNVLKRYFGPDDKGFGLRVELFSEIEDAQSQLLEGRNPRRIIGHLQARIRDYYRKLYENHLKNSDGTVRSDLNLARIIR